MRNKQNRNWKGGYQIDGIAYTKGEYSKYVHGYKGGVGGPMGGRKIDHKILTCYMNDPKQMLWRIFCALVQPSTLGDHCQRK